MMLKLSIPEPDPRLQGMVETDPKKVRDWLIALPASNVIEAGRMMLEALASLNRIRLDADERSKLLQEYQSKLEMLSGGFEVAYATPGLPMEESARNAAQLARSLWLELATSWKLALMDKLERKFAFFSAAAKPSPSLIHGIFFSYWRTCQISGRLYQNLPEGVWLEMHQLFRYAAEHRVLDEPQDESPKHRSIGTLYKQVMLLALADPHRFAGPEFDKVIDIIENYAIHAHFQKVNKPASSAGFFLIELDKDTPPIFVGNRDPSGLAGQALLLDTIELAQKLHKVEQGIEKKAPGASDRIKVMIWLEILRRVMRQWSIAPQRLYQRIPAQTSVEIVLGIKPAVGCLREQAGLTMPRDHLTTWQVLNESPGGFGVLARDLPEAEVRVGEIVALRAVGAPAWMVASIRWLQQRSDGAMEMGLQVLSAKAQPALLKALGTEQRTQSVLLLPAIPALRQSARVLSPKGIYIPLREYALVREESEQPIRAAKLVEQQFGYDLFEFSGEAV